MVQQFAYHASDGACLAASTASDGCARAERCIAAQDERPFVSARRVMNEMGEPYASTLEMVCFHTVSKGTLGECGMRGGCAT